MKGIFFDASGVLYHQPYRNKAIQDFLARHRLPIPDAKRVKRLTREATARAGVGALGREGYFDILLAAWGVADPTLRLEAYEALAASRTRFVLYDDVIDVIKALRARGFKLGVITDTVMTTEEIINRFVQLGLDIRWDGFASSMEVGAKKPDRRMYEVALAQSRLDPADAVFVGHDQDELDGAQALGMTTVAVRHKKPVQGDFVITEIAQLAALPLLQQADQPPVTAQARQIGMGLAAFWATIAPWGADLPLLNWI